MNFPYRKYSIDPRKSPFPQKKTIIRPIIQIDLDSKDGPLGYLVLIDSGNRCKTVTLTASRLHEFLLDLSW